MKPGWRPHGCGERVLGQDRVMTLTPRGHPNFWPAGPSLVAESGPGLILVQIRCVAGSFQKSLLASRSVGILLHCPRPGSTFDPHSSYNLHLMIDNFTRAGAGR